jgi:hypothetical protein
VTATPGQDGSGKPITAAAGPELNGSFVRIDTKNSLSASGQRLPFIRSGLNCEVVLRAVLADFAV